MSRRRYLGALPTGANASLIGKYDAAEGGYLFGYMDYPDGIYALYLAPKAAEVQRVYLNNRTYHVNSLTDRLNGRTNTDQYISLAAAGSPQACPYCRNYRGPANKNDWYLPSEYEFNLMIRCFKPDTSANIGLYGTVPNAIPPKGNATADPWGQTAFTEFRTGGEQALVAGAYWVSTSGSSNQVQMQITATTANRGSGTVDFNAYVRPIRKKLIQLKTKQVVLGTAWAGGNVNWTVPAGVTSVSVLCVGCGTGGNTGAFGDVGGIGGSGGIEGEIRYMNNISVTPGQVISCHVSQVPGVATSFGSSFTSASGGTAVSPRVTAGNGGAGGFRQGGNGGSGTSKVDLIVPTNARVALGNGSPGAASGFAPKGGDGGAGEWPGGGGGGGGGGGTSTAGGADLSGGVGGAGGRGAIRIIWPGNTRQFPSTGTEDQSA